MKDLIHGFKRQLWKTPAIARPLVRWKLREAERSFSASCSQHGFDVATTSATASLVQSLKAQRGERSTCFVVGSGASIVQRLDELHGHTGKCAFYTCNFGGLSGLPIDLWTIELASDAARLAPLSGLQADVVRACRVEQTYLVAKNIWEGKMTPSALSRDYAQVATIRDTLLPGVEHLLAGGRGSIVAFDYMFDCNQYFVIQAFTSIITLVQLAVFAGYADIRIIGLDGGGPHFFHEFLPEGNEALTQRLRAALPAAPAGTAHAVGSPAKAMLPALRDWLAQREVALSW